ncbi:MAG: hypothetical protein O3B73_09355 [bacterium]|nr:hypothetical protein [bacterium]
MDTQLLVILFLVFSALSAGYKKLQELRNPDPDETKLRRKHPTQEVGSDSLNESPDLSEWEILLGAPRIPERPTPKSVARKFRESRREPQVEEPVAPPEFQEVRVERPVREFPLRTESGQPKSTGRGKQGDAYHEKKPGGRPTPSQRTSHPKSKSRRRQRLSFSRKSIRQAIVYNEIIGPPRAENMPF